MPSEEQFRRVGDFGQSGVGHLEHADLVRGAEAVLHRAQQPELVRAFALEIQDGIDHMFQDARTGDGTFFGDVTHENEHLATPLGNPDQLLGAGANLSDGAGGGIQCIGVHGLDGIDDRYIRAVGRVERREDVADVRSCRQQDRRIGQAQTRRAQADLVHCFFA